MKNTKENGRRRKQSRRKFFGDEVRTFVRRKKEILNMIHDHMKLNGIPTMFTDLDLVCSDSKLIIKAPETLHSDILECLKEVKWVPDYIICDVVMVDDYASEKE